MTATRYTSEPPTEVLPCECSGCCDVCIHADSCVNTKRTSLLWKLILSLSVMVGQIHPPVLIQTEHGFMVDSGLRYFEFPIPRPEE